MTRILDLPEARTTPDLLLEPSMNDESGFTLSEVLVVILVTGFFVTLIMNFTFSFWRYSYLLEADQDTLNTRLNAGDIIREQIGTSSGMIMQNGIPDANTNNPDPGDISGQHWLIIHAIPGNQSTGNGTTKPLVYYKRLSINTSGAIIMNGSQPYEDEYVLYIDGTKKQLLLRSIANSSATNNRLKTSCPPTISTPACPADKAIVGDLASVDTRYFSRTGNLIDWTSVFDATLNTYIGPDFTAVDVIELKLNITKKPIFQKTNATINSTTIRVALRNT